MGKDKNHKQCPFCASKDVKVVNYSVSQGTHSHKEYQVVCQNCGACGPNDLGESGAIEMWNMRREFPEQQVPSRPNKIQDALALEQWALDLHKAVFEEWELSIDGEDDFSFWEWLENHYPAIMSEFNKSYKVT